MQYPIKFVCGLLGLPEVNFKGRWSLSGFLTNEALDGKTETTDSGTATEFLRNASPELLDFLGLRWQV
jgi:hypothetical protein